MMGGGAFILLKTGCIWPESAKQTEIRLANLPKILSIVRFWETKPPVWGDNGLQPGYLRRFPPGMANLPESVFLLSRSQF
jgi:hypothetical protein